jgi:4-amino-4-deoxy-L-arabinose transferase-like glycosyltransferase
MSPPVGRASRSEVVAVALFAVVPLLPFLPKAFSIDAPVFIAVAEQILAHPLDPFGFQMIWDPTSPDVWVFNRNPPLVSYYLAPWIALFGPAETWLHAAMLPFSLAAALFFLGICRRTADAGLAPAFLLVATPAYLLLATTLMVDVPLLAWMLFAVYALLRSTDSHPAGWQWAAGLAAAAAGPTKYVGFSINIIGVVLNRIQRRQGLYYGGYPSYYAPYYSDKYYVYSDEPSNNGHGPKANQESRLQRALKRGNDKSTE